ncbi:MAG: hypothetical protein ACR2LJ_11955 [Acidimicrobiales bacterium]
MAFNLPVEGEDGPFVGQALSDAVTCDAGATVAEARHRLRQAGADVAVVTSCEGLVVGDLDEEALAGSDDDRPLLDVMRPVPSTVRPSATVSSLSGSSPSRAVVTTSDGRLLGQAVVEAVGGHEGHDHEGHDHEGHDHRDDDNDEASSHLRPMEQELTETMEAVADHFGDREPSDTELRSYLRDRLVSEGRTPEEADRFMAELDDEGQG